MLEVVGVTGVVHMGQIQSGLRSAIRIIQVKHEMKITLGLEICIIRNREKIYEVSSFQFALLGKSYQNQDKR